MAVNQTNEQSFETDVLKQDGYTMVDFWAEWCMPCKRLMPVLDVVSQQNQSVKFFKVNVDENPDLASSFNIRTIPTLILFKDGKPIQVKNGGAPAVELNDWIRLNAK